MLRCFAAIPILLAGLLLSHSADAETAARARNQYLIHPWQTDDGLSQNWISSIAQTRDGYLWIGTRYGGLARFDGIRFVSFTPQNTPALKDVQVERLTLDASGTLWIVMGNESITTMRGGRFELRRNPRAEPRLRVETTLLTRSNLQYFALENSELAEFDPAQGTHGWRLIVPVPAALPSRAPIYPADNFHLDRTGAAWYVSADRKLARFADGRCEPIAATPGLAESEIRAVTTDIAGQLWVATPQHLAVWNGNAFEDRTPTNGPAPTDILQMVCSGNRNGIWVLESNRLRKFSNGNWVAEAHDEHLKGNLSAGPPKLYSDSYGNAWIVSYGHGLLHVKSDGTLHQLTEADGLPSDLITCWFQDNEGNVWIGTAGGGIARIRERVFQVFGSEEGLPGKVIRSVSVDEHGDVWAGTMSGHLIRWRDGDSTMIPLPSDDVTPVESITTFPADRGSLWVGSLHHGLMQLNAAGQITRPFPAANIGSSVRILFEDNRKQLWIGALVNLYRFSAGELKWFGAEDGFQPGVAIGALAEDRTGALWIGTGPGDLWRFRDEHFTRFPPPDEWPSARFVSLLADTNGVIWAGTLGNGLLRFQNGKFTRFTTAEGLPDDNVTQLLDDGAGQIWGGTYAGIFHVRKSELTALAEGKINKLACSVYGRLDGLPALECTGGFNPACWRAADNRLWFSTVNGLVSVQPSTVIPNRRPPTVVIEELRVDDGPVRSLSSLPSNDSAIEIEPGKHYLQFRFTGLSFTAPDKIRFNWKLQGDREWHDSNNQRVVGCGPLPPGKYRLLVRACNGDGVWNETGTALAFAVLPYFWQTWSFKIMVAAATMATLLILVIVTLRRRYRNSVERLKRQHEMERERARIARDLHDDLGTSLTQISMLSSLANRDKTEPTEARQIVEQIRNRAHSMVTDLDEIVWAVNPRNDSLMELINYLGNFAEEFLRSTQIRCRLNIPTSLPHQALSAEVRHNLFLALKEILNNAVRHSGASIVRLSIELESDAVIIRVEDDGKGFTQGTHPGNGLLNIRKRLEQLGGSAATNTLPGKGTTITLYLPFTPQAN